MPAERQPPRARFAGGQALAVVLLRLLRNAVAWVAGARKPVAEIGVR